MWRRRDAVTNPGIGRINPPIKPEHRRCPAVGRLFFGGTPPLPSEASGLHGVCDGGRSSALTKFLLKSASLGWRCPVGLLWIARAIMTCYRCILSLSCFGRLCCTFTLRSFRTVAAWYAVAHAKLAPSWTDEIVCRPSPDRASQGRDGSTSRMSYIMCRICGETNFCWALESQPPSGFSTGVVDRLGRALKALVVLLWCR